MTHLDVYILIYVYVWRDIQYTYAWCWCNSYIANCTVVSGIVVCSLWHWRVFRSCLVSVKTDNMYEFYKWRVKRLNALPRPQKLTQYTVLDKSNRHQVMENWIEYKILRVTSNISWMSRLTNTISLSCIKISFFAFNCWNLNNVVSLSVKHVL